MSSMGKQSAKASVSRSKRQLFPSPTAAAPWLVIPYGKGTSQNQALYNICEPYNRTCRKSIPELMSERYSYWQKPSHQGWLINLCHHHDEKYDNYKLGDCFLWNPTTLETIRLPSLSHWFGYSTGYYIVDCVLSSTPDSDDSMILFLFTDGVELATGCQLFFVYCHPGDEQWRTKNWCAYNILSEYIESLLWFKDKFYIMCKYERNLAIEKQKCMDASIELRTRTIEVIDKDTYPLVGGLDTCKEILNFVATDDELYFIPIRYTGKIVIQIVVMRLDLSAMAWKVVYNIGDHVLFIGCGNTTAFCSAAKMGLAKGCLYFTLPDDQSLYKFDIESTINSVIVPFLNLPKPWQDPYFIMMPNGPKRKREEDIMSKDESKTNVAHTPKDGKHVGDFGKAPTWGILNGDMVECIGNYLHRVDYIHLRSVCKPYRALLPMVKNTSSSTTTGTYLSPWLMFSRDHNCTTFNFLNPMHNNENYLLKLPDLVRTVIRFQKGGWLLLSRENMDYYLFFYNPFSRETIELPLLPVNFTFSSVSFTSLPTSSDCVVFATELKGYNSDEVCLYFIRKGETIWTFRLFTITKTKNYIPSHNTPVFYNGVFYCVDYNGSLGVFDLKDYNWKVLERPHQQFCDVYPSFLVECGGELLLVKMGHLGTLFGIFRLDFSRMYWVKIKNLGNHMLFVSFTSCVSAIAPNNRMENKVYFPRLCMNGEGVLFYCLATGSYRSFGSRHSASDFTDTEGWYSNCTWIEPNWTKSTAQELDWVKPPS